MEEKKDFKEVKVKVSGATKEHTETLDRSMLYSGVNIFGTLTNLYLSQKEQYQTGGQQSSPISRPSEALSGASGNSMMSLGNEVLSIFKKMQKRDSITKIKACQELKKYVDSLAADSDELPNLLTFFLYHLCRILLNEQDKLVREAAHDAFTSFITKDKRRLGPHIKKIFPLWYCSFFDPAPEVGRIAKANFELAFPIENQPKIFQFSYKMFLHFCNQQLQQTNEDSSQDKKTNEEIYDRVTCSVLCGLANAFSFLKKWSVEDQSSYHKKLVEVFELYQPAKGKQVNVLWSFLGAKYKGSIKSACLQFIASFIAEMPRSIVNDHVKALTPAIMQLVAEENPTLQTIFWREALFTLCQHFPDCWDSVQIKKDVLPKLYKCLKENAFGAPTALYENFVKFLSVCPLYKLDIDDKANKASFKDRCGLIREVLLMLYQGIQSEEAVSFHQELIACLYECITFILLKRLQTVKNDDDLLFAVKQMEKVLQLPLKDFVACYTKSQSKHQRARTLRSSFQLKFIKMFKDLAQRNFNQTVYKQICQIVVVELVPSSRNAMRIVDSLQAAELPEPYRSIVHQEIVSQVFNRQTQMITKMVGELGRTNIDECYECCRAHARIVYTAVKRGLALDPQLELMQVGDLLAQVIKKEKLAKNVLTQQHLALFKDLSTALVEISVLYLAINFPIHNQFSKILLALGLLDQEVSQLNSLEQVLFRPDFAKAKLDSYYSVLRESDEIHDLMVGALSLKMLAPEAVVEYQSLINQVIGDSVLLEKHAILNEDDLELVRTQVVSQLYSENPVDKTAAYLKSVQALCEHEAAENDELRDLLLQALLSMKDDKYFDKIWTVFQSAIRLDSYKQRVIAKLQEQVTLIIAKKSDLAEFNHLTKVITLFVQKLENKVHVLGQVLLREQNFTKLEDSCLPLKMFKDLFLQGGVGFDVQQLFTAQSAQQYEYVWLASVFLSIKHLVSLSSLMELRRQLLIFVETEVVPAIIGLASTHTDFVIDVFGYLKQTKQLHTFELLARLMADQSDPVLMIKDFKRVFSLTEASAQSLLESNFTSTQEDEFLVVTLQVLSYYILDEPVVKQLYSAVTNNLLTTITKLQLDVYMALDHWLGKDSQAFQLQLLDKLLQHQSHEMQQIAITLIHSLLVRYGQTIQSQINCQDLYNVLVLSLCEVDSCQNVVTLCKVIRKTQSWYPDSIVASLLHAARDRAEHFDKVIAMQSRIKPFEVEMLQEMAETILVCPLTVTENSLTPSIEENLYFLFGCGFEPLQKAAYVLLKFIYENFIPPVEYQSNEEDDLKNLVSKAEETKVTSTAFKNISPSLLRLIDEAPSNEDNQEFVTELDALVYGENDEGIMSNKVFGYLLSWNSLLLKIEHGRIKSQLQSDNSQYLQVLAALTEFLETDNTTYHMLLLSLVPYLPKISKKGIQDSFEISSFQPEYCKIKEPKHAQKMCLMTLINFMKSFPSLGRKFYQECDRQLLDIMLPYIKSVISPAILENEIKKIEMSQLELGANSELTFVLFKSTKEVIATYNKSAELSCQLKIKIPHDYPLKSVVVDIGEQLKLKQTQIRKWTLSIRNLLQSRNGDIISAILLWKSNIDREMQGIEECTICYSVMHQTDKSLPSMQCRNCKNKFHVACIRKWFNTSNKSNCPLCQTFFFQ